MTLDHVVHLSPKKMKAKTCSWDNPSCPLAAGAETRPAHAWGGGGRQGVTLPVLLFLLPVPLLPVPAACAPASYSLPPMPLCCCVPMGGGSVFLPFFSSVDGHQLWMNCEQRTSAAHIFIKEKHTLSPLSETLLSVLRCTGLLLCALAGRKTARGVSAPASHEIVRAATEKGRRRTCRWQSFQGWHRVATRRGPAG